LELLNVRTVTFPPCIFRPTGGGCGAVIGITKYRDCDIPSLCLPPTVGGCGAIIGITECPDCDIPSLCLPPQQVEGVVLLVELLEATALDAVELFGGCNPYAVLQIGTHEVRVPLLVLPCGGAPPSRYCPRTRCSESGRVRCESPSGYCHRFKLHPQHRHHQPSLPIFSSAQTLSTLPVCLQMLRVVPFVKLLVALFVMLLVVPCIFVRFVVHSWRPPRVTRARHALRTTPQYQFRPPAQLHCHRMPDVFPPPRHLI
jgi:hypothetical protein